MVSTPPSWDWTFDDEVVVTSESAQTIEERKRRTQYGISVQLLQHVSAGDLHLENKDFVVVNKYN